MKIYVSILLTVLCMAACSSSKTPPGKISEVKRKIESKDYTIIADFANPMRGRQVVLSSGYDLKIKNDSAYAYLPYFGVAYSIPYNSEGGIKFAEPMKSYTIKPNKKDDGWDIRFNVDTRGFNYQFFVKVFNNGSSSFSVSSNQRESISFSGEVK